MGTPSCRLTASIVILRSFLKVMPMRVPKLWHEAPGAILHRIRSWVKFSNSVVWRIVMNEPSKREMVTLIRDIIT